MIKIAGRTPIPAPLARRLLREAGPNIKVWVRRLYTDPEKKHLITGDSRSRFFTHSMRQFLIARDQTCRTPYCDAPIRHINREHHRNGHQHRHCHHPHRAHLPQPAPSPSSPPWQGISATTGPPVLEKQNIRLPVIDIIFPERVFTREILYVC